MSTPLIGSASWDDEFKGTNDNEFNLAVIRRLGEVRWDRVLELCSSLRNGMKCKRSIKIKHGAFNLVKLIEFEDGLKWIFRTPVDDGDVEIAADFKTRIKVEVATYKYLKERTSIPIPAVYAYSAEVDQDIGVPFMVLEYLHGTIASSFNLDDKQLDHVHRQLAAIIIELATHKLDRIGSLVLDDSGDFSIGTDIETNKGPFDKASEFYDAVSKHRFHSSAGIGFEDNLEAQQNKETLFLPLIFNSLMPTFTNCADERGPFSLTHPDLGFHNILLDSNLNVVGMIDCDTVVAAPLHVVAQVSWFAKLERPPVGMRIRNERERVTYENGPEHFIDFVGMLKAAEERFECGNAVSEAFVSDAAALYRSLNHYREDGLDLEAWHQSYLYMYYRKIKGPDHAREFSKVDDSANDNEENGDTAEDTAGQDGQWLELEDVEDNNGGENHNDSRLQDQNCSPWDYPSQSWSEDRDHNRGCDPDDNWAIAEAPNSRTSTTAIATNGFENGANNRDQSSEVSRDGCKGSENEKTDWAKWAAALFGGFLHPMDAVAELGQMCLDKLDPLATAAHLVQLEV